MFPSAGDLTDKLFLFGWKETCRLLAHCVCICLLIFFSTASYCVSNAAFWHDFKNISSVWLLTLCCDPSQDRELRPEEMDGMYIL